MVKLNDILFSFLLTNFLKYYLCCVGGKNDSESIYIKKNNLRIKLPKPKNRFCFTFFAVFYTYIGKEKSRLFYGSGLKVFPGFTRKDLHYRHIIKVTATFLIALTRISIQLDCETGFLLLRI